MGQFLSKYQCDFRKGFSDQNCLVMLKKWKRQLIKEIFLTDLLKAFDYLSHELITLKIEATFQKSCKELGSIPVTALGVKYSLVYHKGQY